MSYTPNIGITNDLNSVTIEDYNSYGEDNVDVEYKVVRKSSEGDKDVVVPYAKESTFATTDGCYQIEVCITCDGVTTCDIYTTFQKQNIENCMEVCHENWLNASCCAQNGDNNFEEMMKLKTGLRAIDCAIEDEDYKKAQCIAEGLNEICGGPVQSCGC